MENKYTKCLEFNFEKEKKVELKEQIIKEFPFPIAGVFSEIFNEQNSLKEKIKYIPKTIYQLMRTVGLTLIGQYLDSEIPQGAERDAESFSKTISMLKYPLYSDWITLMLSINKRGKKLGLDFFPEIYENLKKVLSPRFEVKPELGLRSKHQNLNIFEVFQGLRNAFAHGMEKATEDMLSEYINCFYFLLSHFTFLKNYKLLALVSSLEEEPLRVLVLKGKEPKVKEMESNPSLEDGFQKGTVIMKGPSEKVQSLFPLFNRMEEEEELLYLYDGHIFRDYKKEIKRLIVYVGNETKKYWENTDEGESLRSRLEAKKIEWRMTKRDIAPWSLPTYTNEYTKKILESLIDHQKYIPEVYTERKPFSDSLRHFLKEEYYRLFLISGPSGSGKTATVSHLVAELLEDRDSIHSVLFLRGGDFIDGEETNLFKEFFYKLGVKEGEFRGFPEFLDYYQKLSKDDTEEERKFILILDAINEHRYPEKLFLQLIELAEQTNHYKWIKIIATIRDEYLAIREFSLRGHEENPLYKINNLLYPAPQEYSFGKKEGIWHIPPLNPTEQRAIYEGLQREKAKNKPLPASKTPWDKLPSETKNLLNNPLFLLLFMRTYDDREADTLYNEWELFREYVNSLENRYDKFWQNLNMILSKMLEIGSAELSDEDVGEIGEKWRSMEIAYEQRDKLEPLEVAILVGVMVKKPGSEGGTYVIPFQGLCEALLFEKFRKEDERFSKESLKKWMSYRKFPELQGALSYVAEEIIKSREAKKLALFIREGFAESLIPALSRETTRIKEEKGEEFEEFLLKVLREGNNPETGADCILLANNILWGKGFERNRIFLLSALKRYLEEERIKDYILAATYGNLGDIYEALGKAKEALDYYEKANEIMEEIAKKNPIEQNRRNLAISYGKLGDIYTKLGKAKQALQYYENDLKISEEIARKNPTEKNRRNLAISYGKLGDIYTAVGKAKQALQYYENDLKISEEIAKQNPTEENRRELAISYGKLGDIYTNLGKSKKALDYFEKDNKIMEEIVKQNPTEQNRRDLAISYSKLGDLYATLGKAKVVLEYFEKSNKIMEEIVKQNPTEQNRRDLAISYSRLGDIYISLGKAKQALQYYENDLKISEEIAKQNPTEKNRRYLAIYYSKLGDIYATLGKAKEAMEYYKKAVEIIEEIVEQNPTEQNRRGLAISYSKLGDIYKALGKANETLQYYVKYNKIIEEIANKNPIEQNRRGLAISYSKIGDIYTLLRKAKEALDYYKKLNKIMEEIAKQNPTEENRRYLAISYSNVGNIYEVLGKAKEALEYFEKYNEIMEEIVEQNPIEQNKIYLGNSYGKMGIVLLKENQDEAILNLKKALKIHKEIYLDNWEDSVVAFELVSILFILYKITKEESYFIQAKDIVCRFKIKKRIPPEYESLLFTIESISPC